MATKLAKLEKLEEGEYEAPFGKVIIKRADGGYKIVAYVDEKAASKNAVKHILQQFMTAAGEKPV